MMLTKEALPAIELIAAMLPMVELVTENKALNPEINIDFNNKAFLREISKYEMYLLGILHAALLQDNTNTSQNTALNIFTNIKAALDIHKKDLEKALAKENEANTEAKTDSD